MLVYRCRISGDEMLSDAFPLTEVKDAEGNVVPGVRKCASKNVSKGGDDIDIGAGNAFGGGDEDGGVDDTVETVNNIIDRFSYTETQIGTASDFKGWLKEYMMAVRTKLREAKKDKEEIQAFMGTASGIAKFFITNFKDVQFYLGPSFCADSMCFSIYEEGALTPHFYYITAGYIEEKF